VVPLLKSTPDLRPVAIFDEIRRRHPEIGAGIRRTLARALSRWLWALGRAPRRFPYYRLLPRARSRFPST
jgi:hypothetical protein